MININGVNFDEAAAAPPALPPVQFAQMTVGLVVGHAKLQGPDLPGDDTGDRVILQIHLAMTRDQAAGVINALAGAHRMCSPLIIPQ